MLSGLIRSMRPRQWTKNVFVFAALVFDKQLLIPESFVRTLAGFVLFCLVSSSVYIFNDIADIDADREHPQKRHRPIASGRLPLSVAWIAGIGLMVVSLVGGYLLSEAFALVVAAYFLLNIAYSKWLKHVLDPCGAVFPLVVRGHDAAGAVPGFREAACGAGAAIP
jgi:4-hydroxybenzoate polyprenyltransferase